jgi:SpoVK/Ycf46/Vps4 family AAA+-type ATPase
MTRLEQFDRHLRQTDRKEVRNFNLLFYGPPGTGKSELARYIAERLDRELIVKGASDLLNAYVGATEQLIARAFEEAEREEAVLVLDEADTFLFSRNRAVRSWEISFTNEFLTRMERFRGILICTTNRMADLDPASLRRFIHKIRFDYLTPEGNQVFYERFLQGLTSQPLSPADRALLLAQTTLAPGDFKVVRDRLAYAPEKASTHEILIRALMEEAEIKMASGEKKVVGF